MKENILKHSKIRATVMLFGAATALLAGCSTDGKTLFGEDSDHKVNVFTASQDSKPLSVSVRAALRNNGQTAVSRIRVSQDSEDTVKLTGNVDNDAVRHEAERVAYQVEGVRFVVNNLNIRR